MHMAARVNNGRLRTIQPVSFRLNTEQRAALDGAAARAGVTANEHARNLTVEALSARERSTGHGHGASRVTPMGNGVTPGRELAVEYDPEDAR